MCEPGKFLRFVTKSKSKEYAWEVKKLGDSFVVAYCKYDFSEYGALACESIYEFRMNNKNLRFIRVYPLGYWTDNVKGNPSKEGEDTPYIEIGKCSPL